MIDQIKDEIEQEVDKWMCKGVSEDDPFWKLFDCKEVVNKAIVEAVKYGFRQGYKRATEESINDKIISTLKQRSGNEKMSGQEWLDKLRDAEMRRT